MRNLEDEFKREFKKEVGVYASKDIYSVPLPVEASKWEVSGTELYFVKGIEDKVFANLNGTIVKKIPSGKEVKKRVIDRAARSFKRNADGTFVYEDVKVPKGAMVVISDKILSVPYSYKGEYGYVDFVKKKDGKIEYFYIVKKENLFKVNQTALAVSVKNMKNYSGMGYQTWRIGMIYLHIIPYKPSSIYVGSKILKTGHTLDYGKEVRSIVSYWEKMKLIPNIKLSSVEDTNLVMKNTEVGYTDYVPYEVLSVGDRELYGSSEEGNAD